MSSTAGPAQGALAWYRRNRRDLPWRRERDPYRVWLSEVMLQQTTVKTATPYYEAFLARFPDLEALAAAREEDVLARLVGPRLLPPRAQPPARGRARGRAPRRPVPEDAGGRAGAVPGVGLYTASAVLSIVYDVPLPVVDGNVRRVLARLFALRGPEWSKRRALLQPGRRAARQDAPRRLEPGAHGARGDGLHAAQARGLPGVSAAPDLPGPRAGLVEELPEGRARRAPVDVTVAAALVETGRTAAARRAAPRAGCSAACGRSPRPPSSHGGLRTWCASCASATASRSSPAPSACARATPSPTVASASRATAPGSGASRPVDEERYRWTSSAGGEGPARLVHDPQARGRPALTAASAGLG